MLKIGIHDGDHGRGSGHHALHARTGKPAPPNAADAAQAGPLLAKPAGNLCRAVGAVVVDDDNFTGRLAERCHDALNDDGYVPGLVERRQHDCYLWVRYRNDGKSPEWTQPFR